VSIDVLQERRYMYKKTPVPYDGSPESERAVEHAIRLAGSLDEKPRITLLNVIDTRFIVQVSESVYIDMESLEAYSRSILEDLKERFMEGFEIDTVTRNGRPWEEIVEEAKRGGYDIIIMGSHGYGFIDRLLIGTTAENVVRHAECPVLIVKSRREA